MKSPALPYESAWIVTNACNLKCLHCFYDCTERPEGDELSPQASRLILDNLRRLNQMFILFMGGEPFLRSDFIDLLSLATRSFCCYVYTNGTLISSNLASALREARVNAVFINVLGASAKLHDSLTGVPGSLDQTVEGIKALVKAGVRVIVTTVLMKPNIPDVPEITELATSLGASKVNFLRFFPIGRGNTNKTTLEPDVDELRNAVEQIRLLGKRSSIEVGHPYFPRIHNCCKLMYTICANGDVASCSYLRNFQRFGSLLRQDVAEVWNSDAFCSFRETVPHGRCQACPNLKSCGGGCRASAYLATSRWDAPDPFCFFMPEEATNGMHEETIAKSGSTDSVS